MVAIFYSFIEVKEQIPTRAWHDLLSDVRFVEQLGHRTEIVFAQTLDRCLI